MKSYESRAANYEQSGLDRLVARSPQLMEYANEM